MAKPQIFIGDDGISALARELLLQGRGELQLSIRLLVGGAIFLPLNKMLPVRV
jgi:hypothetical protein